MREAGPLTGSGSGRNYPPRSDQEPLAVSTSDVIAGICEVALVRDAVRLTAPIVRLGAEIVHEGRMDGGLALLARVPNTLGNSAETGDETGEEIAVEKFLYGTHGSLLILFLLAGSIYFAQAAITMGNFA